jgi:Protein of unknown function (DUF1566)
MNTPDAVVRRLAIAGMLLLLPSWIACTHSKLPDSSSGFAQSSVSMDTQSKPQDVSGPAQSDVWKDPATGLTWAGQTSDKQVSWEEAGKYCDNLKTGGYSWRLPTENELSGIYDPTNNSYCGVIQGTTPIPACHVKGGIRLSGWLAWSSDLYPVHPRWAWLFSFTDGKREYLPFLNWYGLHALCVVK